MSDRPAMSDRPPARDAGIMPISVVICCANCADTLGAAIESAQWADEVIVVDSGSQDRTGEIGQALADRYMVEPWRGYTGQKSFGTSLAKNDWVFVLDGDETITPALRDEIARLSKNAWQAMDVMHVRRHNFIMGRSVRAWDPDWQSRLIHRHRCQWADEVLHDDRLPSHRSRQCRLRGHIEHKRHSEAGFSDYFDGKLEDARLLDVARQMHQRGRRCSIFDLWLRPVFAFLKFYIIKGAWRDGAFGLLIGQKAARGAQLKYAALWAVQNNLAQPERSMFGSSTPSTPTSTATATTASTDQPRPADPSPSKPATRDSNDSN